MARGAVSKEKIIKKILDTFEGSFLYDKEIRIPVTEDGELIQIKVTLTAAKTNVESGDDVKMPGIESNEINFGTQTTTKEKIEVTEEEKQNVATLLKNLGL